jgi:hypothetical protein
MFARSTVEYLTSKAIVADLTADPEKRWAEWSRGKPITEKGIATLLHEFRIFSRDVGPRNERVKLPQGGLRRRMGAVSRQRKEGTPIRSR